MKNIKIRLEEPSDYRIVEALTYKAFSQMELPGRERCDEPLLAHKLRKAPSFVPELDFVALADAKIVGNILYSKAQVVNEEDVSREVLTFGPLSVLPEYQGQGVGAALVRHSAERARQLGYPGILIFGHPTYYPRFGFESAEKYGITTPEGKNFDAFMALELTPGALEEISGRLFIDPVYELDPEEARVFNKQEGYAVQ